jgi:uncharacterized membrane protein
MKKKIALIICVLTVTFLCMLSVMGSVSWPACANQYEYVHCSNGTKLSGCLACCAMICPGANDLAACNQACQNYYLSV